MYQERIRDIYDHLSPGYRRIAEYLLNNYRDAAFMTAAEVGVAAGIDTASVVRFAQRLGYPGYPELIAEVQEEVKRDLRRVYEPDTGDRSAPAAFQRSIIEDRNNLDYILLHNDANELQAMVDLLRDAPRIFVIGESGASFLAQLFALRLTSLGRPCWALPGDTVARMTLATPMNAGDLMVGISPTALSSAIAVALRVAREEGLHTIAIVGKATHRAAQVAHHVLYAPARTTGLFYSPTAFASVLHALVRSLSAQASEESAMWAARADRLMRRFSRGLREEPIISLRDVLSEFANTRAEGDPAPDEPAA